MFYNFLIQGNNCVRISYYGQIWKFRGRKRVELERVVLLRAQLVSVFLEFELELVMSPIFVIKLGSPRPKPHASSSTRLEKDERLECPHRLIFFSPTDSRIDSKI